MKYIFWGVATTIVYLIVRLISMKIFDDTMLPVLISQTLTIIFAFVVNKLFVFTTKQTKSVFVQFIRFLWGRLFVAGIDFFLTYVMIEKYSNIFIR
ncbi:GtrA family protein [Leuconostoc mesenteroides]|uniref:GtrA family protein n=1 Tax=Leuconostoc mesenteroides TaxID=1245 RepID=UPI001CBA7857|nr:GtrA family protein [Leuconostoc mesenteroides]